MILNEKHICVIGDSFAGHRTNSEWNTRENVQDREWSWVNLLERNNTGVMLGESFPGQSYFHQRRWYYNNMLFSNIFTPEETVLIFVHTAYARLPHVENVPVTRQVLEADKNDRLTNEMLYNDNSGQLFELARNFYLSDLYVDEFYLSSFLGWLSEIPALTVRYKKVIHLVGFPANLNNLPNFYSRFYLGKLLTHNSILVSDSLKGLSLAERGNDNWGGPDMGPDRANHFNQHNNYCLFEQLAYIINNVPGNTFYDLDLSKWDLKRKSLREPLKLHRDNFDPNNPVNNPLIV